MRKVLTTMRALLLFALTGKAHAAVRREITVPGATGHILVECFASGGSGQQPAVLILSGSIGFRASGYDEIGRTF
jgi:hypothetical protein